jgi:hypothetical protein
LSKHTDNDRPAPQNGVSPSFTEDDLQRRELGPRGVPRAEDPARMTPQRDKKTPDSEFDGHTA